MNWNMLSIQYFFFSYQDFFKPWTQITKEVMKNSENHTVRILTVILWYPFIICCLTVCRSISCEKHGPWTQQSQFPPWERERPEPHRAHQHLIEEELNTRASLNPSIVSTWAGKNGPFTSKLQPSFSERFYNRARVDIGKSGTARHWKRSVASFTGDQSSQRISPKL